MENATQPSITCICITYKRVEFLKRAINCFISQTYPNRQLLVVFRNDDDLTKEHLRSYHQADIRPLETTHEMSLGELRNYAISKSEGQYFCQWDDDDWCHSMRLELQMKAIQDNYKEACVLGHWLLYDKINSTAYISYYGAWAGSILCKRDIITGPINYPSLNKREDSQFINKLFELNCLCPLIAPAMYIYVYHGANTWNSKHFTHLFTHSGKLPPHISNLVSEILEGILPHEDACKLLLDSSVIKEMNYYYFYKPETIQKKLRKLFVPSKGVDNNS